MKSLLIVSRSAPWTTSTAREALDIALSAAAFDLQAALLFLDDGVFQLLAGQQASRLEQKDLSANLKALPLFGIEQCYGAKSSLIERGLQDSLLNLELQWLDDKEVTELFAQYDEVITL